MNSNKDSAANHEIDTSTTHSPGGQTPHDITNINLSYLDYNKNKQNKELSIFLQNVKENQINKRVNFLKESVKLKINTLLVIKERIKEHLNFQYNEIKVEMNHLEFLLNKTYTDEFNKLYLKYQYREPRNSNFSTKINRIIRDKRSNCFFGIQIGYFDKGSF